jgi:hypothetical protein
MDNPCIPLAALKAPEWIGIAAACVALLGVIVAILNVMVGAINERRRTQPIVIAHEMHARRFAENNPDYFAVGAYVTSEGDGPAFNVRFGVEFGRTRWFDIAVRYPYKASTDDPDSGNVERVLRSGARRPSRGATPGWLPILIPQVSLVGSPGDREPDLSRVYWARYESARGQTWETRNPWQRSERLRIRRVRAVRWREWVEHRRRLEAKATGAVWEAAALELLRSAGRDEAVRRALDVPNPEVD